MSINVTVNGNPLNIRQGRMVLSDLDQIKKNERDRRRRLRLEQVRQQSKEISDRLLDRVKNITRQEQKKLESNDNLSSRQLFNEKIMEIQQKYQEDMADIGLAHLSAMLEPDHDEIIQEQERKNKLAALKRGKEAAKQIHEKQQKESAEQQHQNRLRQVRELENLRSTMVAKLPRVNLLETDIAEKEINEEYKHRKSAKKKTRKQCFKKSPSTITKSHTRAISGNLKTRSPRLQSKQQMLISDPRKDVILEEQSVATSTTIPSALKNTATTLNTEGTLLELEHDKISEKMTPTSAAASVEVDKTLRYNPQDYVQSASASTSSSQSDSSSSLSNDCSCLPTNTEQSKCIRTPKQKVNSSANDKVQLYDHSKHQSNVYNKPVGVVEKIHAWNEPSATDLAQQIEKSEAVKSHLMESRKATAQKRGEDAVLREKVRRDYQTLVQNLNHLAVEERKLKANQAEHYQNDVHILQERRKMLKDQHKKKLNRALKTMLPEECLVQCPSYPIERQITLMPREEVKDVDVNAVWEDQCCVNERPDSRTVQSRSKEPESSREEQILDMLKKVEKQKQLLLKEFGADLPSDIFNATMKPLFEKDKSVQAESATHQASSGQQRPVSPEIKVISAPCCTESSRRDKTVAKGNAVKKVEIAVQTTTGTKEHVVEDKSIQVEIVPERGSEPKTINDEVDKVPRQYPLEPKVTVITPEADTNDSTSSAFANTLNDTDNQNFEPIATKHKKATPRKEKQKSYLGGVSKTLSSAKKLPKTLSRSRLNGLRKPVRAAASTPNKKIKIYVNKTGFNIELNPAQTPEVTVDASTQSSQIRSTGVPDQTTTKSYSVKSQSTQIKMRDITDTSTSFASPPPVKPRNILEALTNNISILEMLDSSTNESLTLLRRNVSPVSTPETPSPRTMRMPSNVPHTSRLSRMLRYSSIDSQTNNSSILSSTKNDQSLTTDSSRGQQIESQPMRKHASKQTSSSNGACSCENPECKLMDAKFHHIRNYALKNCPEILQKYEDLQTMCTERIVSLTNLIEKVRSEQKGVELSIINPADETSLMQLPPVKPKGNDLQSVRDLVENIEAIHNQLSKTLVESQNIIKNKTTSAQHSSRQNEINIETQTNEDIQKITSPYIASKLEERVKAKPRIISDKRVNIQLDTYSVQSRPKTLEAATQENNARLTSKLRDEEMIETLSQEILEQSKSLKNNLLTTKECVDSAVDYSLHTDVVDSKNGFPLSSTRNDTSTQKHFSKEAKEAKDFVPLLADIPKVSRSVDAPILVNGRSKPPVSLLSGPYRTEIESSGHELSTIIEFDTPDTVNKSQNNAKSPSSVRKITESRATKATALIDPTKHVAASVNTHEQQQFTQSYDPSTSILASEVAKYRIQTTAARFDSPSAFKTVPCRTEGKETMNKKLQCDTQNKRLSPKEQVQPPIHGISVNINDENKNNDRITSTSSNSFSGLSGISQIASTPSSDVLKYASSPEEMEIALKKLGLGWAITTLKKTREASALSSSSTSDDRTPINTGKKISPVKKQFETHYALPDFSDVSSISVKEASKSTEHAVLLKGRTSTPLHSKLQNSNSNNSATTNTSTTNISENFQEASEGLIIPDIALTSSKTNIKRLENL